MARKAIDLTGMQYTHFTVVRRIPNKGMRVMWELKCQCGRVMTSSTTCIRKGEKISCGCHRSYTKEQYHKKVGDDLIRQRRVINGCWEYTGFIWKDGYGQRSFGQRGKKKVTKVHRIAYEIWKGEIPEGMLVCHSCDNRKCFNPDHLWLGTHADNARDMHEKGRQVNQYGSRHFSAKLSEAIVKECRERYKNGEPSNALAREFSVSGPAMHAAITGKTWRHVS